jgi:hypothetical protein
MVMIPTPPVGRFIASNYSEYFCIVWEGLGGLWGLAGEVSDDFFLDDSFAGAVGGRRFGISQSVWRSGRRSTGGPVPPPIWASPTPAGLDLEYWHARVARTVGKSC